MSAATYVAECYWPDLTDGDVRRGSDGVRRTAAELSRDGERVALTGSLAFPGDGVVFYLFEATSAELVHEACSRALLVFERVVESRVCNSASDDRQHRRPDS